MGRLRQLTTIVVTILLVACAAAGCGSSASSSKDTKGAKDARDTASMTRALVTPCTTRTTGTRKQCRRAASCVLERIKPSGFRAFGAESDAGKSGPATRSYVAAAEACWDEVGIEEDPSYRESPEFITAHAGAYEEQLVTNLRDEVCMPEGGRTKSQCDAAARCVLERLGVVKLYAAAMDASEGKATSAAADAAIARCKL